VKLDSVDPFALNGRELARFRNEKIGFVFQDHHLLPQCSVLENVLVPALVGHRDGAAMEARAKKLIERVGLSGRIDHRPAELSGGERQRVAIARALINNPILLLCDEPTGNLDRKTSASVGSLFRELQTEEKMMLAIVTHGAEFAELFDRRFELIDGKIVPAETAEPIVR
jgi:lipoprotein-releasing system ATP-binding protein